MNKAKIWIKNNRITTAIVLLLVVGLCITSLTLLINKPKNQVNAAAASVDTTSSLSVGGSVPISDLGNVSGSATPLNDTTNNSTADTLAKLKTDPQYQNPRTDIPFDELFRNSDKYKGIYVHYTGEVIQVLGESGNWNLRVNITKKGTEPYSYWQDTVFIYSFTPERVIENDLIEFTAYVNGTTTYKSTQGADVTIPALTIYEENRVGRVE
jgi:hypothetical protein